MIRSLWTVVSILALANLLALLGFAGWLTASDRLNGDRLESVRKMFSETIAEQAARQEKEQADAEAEAARAKEKEAARRPPLTAQDRLLVQTQFDTVLQQQVELTKRTLGDMKRSLDAQRRKLDSDTAAFVKKKSAFEAMRNTIIEIEGDAQFKKALGLYQSLRAPDAANALRELYDKGDREQVVAYLNAMEARKASKILTQFEPPMAADLLERLRTRGVVAAVPEGQ